MIQKNQNPDTGKGITVLVVDDSLAFRWVLRGIFDRHPQITIIGEASDGIKGLEFLVQLKPDVVIMDMEMPLMDGMTALQHLMIHTPTPTIMFSSLTQEGTTRSFDALKNGAVDFVCKDMFFQGKVIESLKETIIRKVVNAALLSVKTVEPAFPDGVPAECSTTVQRVVFCEECGCREVVNIVNGLEISEIQCSKCGDSIELNSVNKYRRNNFITFICAGEGGYSNLLKIIPKLHAEISGSIIVQIYAPAEHVDAFTEYLDSISNIKVIRVQDGLIVEGGICYVASCSETLSLKPYSAHHTLRCSENYSPEDLSPIDAAMISIASIFKSHVAGVILSGNETDGERGIGAIQSNNGSVFVLNSKNCLCKRLGKNIQQKCLSEIVSDESGLVKRIESLHLKAKETVLTA